MCGKEFWAYAEHVYKRGPAYSPIYICSWKCTLAYDKEFEEKKKKGTGLTKTEQVKRMRDSGMSIAQIAYELGCSTHTIIYHLNKIKAEKIIAG